MISSHNKRTSFRIIEPKKFHHAQQIPVSLSNQQIPILTLREDNRINNGIQSSYHDNMTNDAYSDEQQLNLKEFTRQFPQRTRNLSDTDSSYIPVNMDINYKNFMLKKTTSESGISDLDMSEKCTCCPYGYHIDVDFVTFLNNFGQKNMSKQIKKMHLKRNENLQKSMEYVIDEVEKLKQMKEYATPLRDRMDYAYCANRARYCERQMALPSDLKKTIKQIDQFMHDDAEQFLCEQDQCSSAIHSNRSANKSNTIDQTKKNAHYLSNSSLPSESCLLKTSQSFNMNHVEQGGGARRSYSSCAEPMLTACSNRMIKNDSSQQRRRCLSSRTSPNRADFTSLPFRQVHDARRSHSASRRTQSQSPIEKQSYKREIKINLAQPKDHRGYTEQMQSTDQYELKKETTLRKTSVPTQQHRPVSRPVTRAETRPMIKTTEVQEEVLLNLFSCNNSGSISSDSSESLVEIGQNLKINETYERNEPTIEYKNELKCCKKDTLLEKRLIELEKKLQKIPELEIKNNILLEEKKLLLNQLLSRSEVKREQAECVKEAECGKVFRSIGCDSVQKAKQRDVGVWVKSNTRDIGLHVDEPSDKVTQMQTVITNLKDQLKEQTLILEESRAKPSTRDVAVMHVVDRVEEPVKPKPEVRDVAIHHSTIDENKILLQKQTLIINDYIKEIEQLQLENCHLSHSLQELIKKHSKHVVTRGTHAPQTPILYSIGTNTNKTSTRDVQVMYTPKSRDVCLSTDQYLDTRDVGLACNIQDNETKMQLEQLNLIKEKYELCVEENLRKQAKSYRDVNTLCRLDQKECRDVSLGCDMFEKKSYRDVSLKCDLDKEMKKFRDVSIGVELDSKPQQKDANIYVNFTENLSRPVMKDSFSMAQLDDAEKLRLIEQLDQLKKPKLTKNVCVSADYNTRFGDNLVKNSFSSMEQIRTSNKQISTDQIATRESSTAAGFSYLDKSSQTFDCVHQHQTQHQTQHQSQQMQIHNIESERDKLKIVNENLKLQLSQMEERFKNEKVQKIKCQNSNVEAKSYDNNNNSTSISTVTANVNCSSDSNISQIKTSSHETDSIVKLKRQSEFEHHRILKSDRNKRTIEDTVKVSSSVSNKAGDKASEMATWSNKAQINYDCNEITIPIIREQKVNTKPPILQSQFFSSTYKNASYTQNDEIKNLPREKIEEKNASEKLESKNPKSILKPSAVCSSYKLNKTSGKALTFGENEILETETDYGQDESFDKNLGGDNLEIENSNNENDNMKDTFEDEEHDLYSKNESETRSSVCDSEKKDVEEVQEPKSFELELELHIACAILNDSLYEPLKADKNKVAKALNLIQQDWFKLAAQKDSDPILVEEHLNAFYSRFSNLLLERIVNMADLNHNTALHYSVSTGNFEIVNLLLDSKVCDVNSQNKAGYTSIMLAAVVPIKDDFERLTLKRLFSEGNVNIKSTDSGQTALMLAVRHGNKDTVALLLESSADCNAQDKEGSTALMAACEHGHIDIVRLLLDNTNCDPDIKDNDGETAFEIAKNKNRNDIIVLLYAHSTKLRSHHPAIQFSKTRPRIGSAGSIKK